MCEQTAYEVLRIRLQDARVEHALDQPAHWAFGEGLEHAGREAAAVGKPLAERRRRDPGGKPRRQPRSFERDRALPLDLGRRLVARAGDLGEIAKARRQERVAEDVLDVLDEERPRLRIPIVVAVAPAEEEQALGARDGRVEEVALAVQLVLAQRQREATGGRDLTAVVVGEERIAACGCRPLTLLKTAGEDRLETAGANRLGRGNLDALRIRRVPAPDLDLGEQVVKRGEVRLEPDPGDGADF